MVHKCQTLNGTIPKTIKNCWDQEITDHGVLVIGQAIHPDYSDVHISQGTESRSVVLSPNVGQVHHSIDSTYIGESQSHRILQHLSSQFKGFTKLNHSNHDND